MPKQFQTASKDTKVVYLNIQKLKRFLLGDSGTKPLSPCSPAPSFWGNTANAPLYAEQAGAGRMRRLITFLPIRPTNSIYITR